jgi:hypothetical protein
VKRNDKRRHNPGRPPTIDGEKKTLIRCSAALLDAMRARAAADGVAVAEAWREAARRWLHDNTEGKL